MAAKLDLKVDQGATFSHELTWKDSEGNPIDLTGYTARMQIRVKITDDNVVLELTTENGGISLGGVAGTITINITSEQSSNIASKSNVFDLELVSPSNFITRLVQGKVIIDPEVTRS